MSELRISASNIGWKADDDERVLRLMKELGFTGLEIAPTRVISEDPYDHNDQFACYANQIRMEYDLEICSMQSIWRGRDENIFDEQGAAALLSYTERALAFAHAGSVRNLVFGCPRNRNMPEGRTPAEAITFLEQCGSLAERYGAVFAVEANPPLYETNFLNSTADALSYLDHMPSTLGLGINLDMGTIIEMHETLDIMQKAMPYISHVHISEPGLVPVLSRNLHVELKSMLEDVDYDGYVSLEMGTADYQTVRSCLEYLADTFLA